MQISFPANKSIELSFRVGIAGTQQLPSSVAVVLEKDGRSLSYAARQSDEGWSAVVDNPGSTFGAGQVNFYISVILANRTFTPMKSVATITAAEMAPPAPEVVVTQPAPAVEPPITVAPPPVAQESVKKPAVKDVTPTIRTSLLKVAEAAVTPPKPVQKKAKKVVEEPEPFTGVRLTRTKIVTR